MQLGINLRGDGARILSLGTFPEELPPKGEAKAEVKAEMRAMKRKGGHTGSATSQGQVLAKCLPCDISLNLPTPW